MESHLNQKKEALKVLSGKGIILAYPGNFKIWLSAFVPTHHRDFGIKLLKPWVAHSSSIIMLRVTEWAQPEVAGRSCPQFCSAFLERTKCQVRKMASYEVTVCFSSTNIAQCDI